MKHRSLFQMIVGLFVAPKLPAPPPIPDGFKWIVDPYMPRWNFVAGKWVLSEPSMPQDTNTDYVAVPYEDLKWTPEEGFTLHASSNSPSSPAASPASRPLV